MAWSAPTTPVSGTVITVAWAQSAVVDPINWLRTMTGGADPPAADYSITSTGTTATGWVQKVNRSGDTMTSDLQVNRSGLSTPTLGYLILGNNSSYYLGFNGTGHVLATPGLQVTGEITLDPSIGVTLGGNAGATRGRLYDSGGALTVLRTHNNAFGVYTNNLATQIFGADNAAAAPTFKGQAIWHAGNDTRAGVPSGLIGGFATAAGIASGWTRYTAADGRLLVGAGTTFSQTFTENTAVGANWTPFAGISVFAAAAADIQHDLDGATPQVAQASATSHQHLVTAAAQTWVPVAQVIVWASKT